MTKQTISATEASRTFSDLLNKVYYQGQSFSIKRGKEVIAKLSPIKKNFHKIKVAGLNDFFKHLPTLDNLELKAFEKDLQKIRTEMSSEKNSWD